MRAMESALSGLAAHVEAGSAIVDLDPDLLDGSFVADRVVDATDDSMTALIESVRESGQQVPILVRRHPEAAGRYQIAFGHRRARAAAALGIPVRAVVKVLTDAELVVAQGKENLERRDLSYIERAYFALRLEEHGFSREVIAAALGEHKPNLSVLIGVARAVPEAILSAIGPAPKAGRPRWQAMADRIKATPTARVIEVASDPSLAGKPTDERFAAVLAALAPTAPAKMRKAQVWKDGEGRKLARVERGEGRFGLSLDDTIEPGFGDYLLDRLPEILAAYRAGKV